MKKKYLLSLIVFLGLIVCLGSFKVNALSGTDDTQNATYEATSTNTSTILDSTKFLDEYGNCEQKTIHVAMLQQLCNVENNKTKVVSWVMQNDDGTGFKRGNVAQICADYEKNHPGWLVTGGINADQYTLGTGTGLGTNGRHPYTVQPYYPMVADYQKYFSNSWMASGEGSSGRFVGFTNDGSADQLQMVNASSAKTQLMVNILDENDEVIASFPADSFNKTGETVVYSGFYSDTSLGTFIDNEVTVKNLFVVADAELAYCNNSSSYTAVAQAQDAFYGKGTITSKGITSVLKQGQFAVSTTNEELLKYLSVGVKILCQYEYVNETYNNFESTIGFHTVQKDNDVDHAVSGSYNTNQRTRSVFGRKSDGTVVLMVIDDYKETYGVTGYGINAICDAYGIVEAYQMDGGGSAQMAVRQSNGTFKGVTYSADYAYVENATTSQRSIFSALLFVVKDPSYKDEYRVKFELNDGVYEGSLPQIYTSISDLVLPIPTKKGYVFEQWYLDSEFTQKLSFKTSGHITLYAKYLLLGDVDKNEKIDLMDCLLLRLILAKKKDISYSDEILLDCNGDGTFDEKDIEMLQLSIISYEK